MAAKTFGNRDNFFEVRYPYDPRRWKVWKAICEYLGRFIPPDAAVLDLGAGYCDFINQVTAAEKYALDINPAAKEHCADGVTFLNSGVTEIDLPAASIDVVFASNVFEHLSESDLASLFARLEGVMKPNARLILIQPNYYYAYRVYWDDYTHVKAYSHESLPDLLRSKGYDIVRVEKQFLPFSFKGRLPASYALTRLYLALPWRPFAAQMLVVAQRGSGPELRATP